MKQKDKKGIRRDGKNLLKEEGGKEAGKGILSFAPKPLVKGMRKDRRDKLRDIEVFFQELKEGRDIVQEPILAV